MKLRIAAGLVLLSFFQVLAPVSGATAGEEPDFKEVYDLLRANVAGADETELNRAAVQGLLNQLQGRAALSSKSRESLQSNSETGIRTAVFDGSYGYVRITEVGPAAEKQVAKAYQQLVSSNHLKGVVFDLRYAGGHDYASAAALADLFFSTEKPLLDYGDGMIKSKAKTNAFSMPLTALVNRETTGGAEAFAGILRQAQVGLLLGTNTAGKATIGKEFTLQTGQRLWIATSLVKLGNGQLFPTAGLQPDIQVEVSPEDEKAYYEDAYKVLPKAGQLANSSTNQTNLSVTNRLPRHRTSEAELVRMHRDGELPDAELPPAKSRQAETPPHVVYDPVLARAIDLLKGLSVVQQFRSN